MLEEDVRLKLLAGFEELLRNPQEFCRTYKQPAGEDWKHFQWDVAKSLIEYQEKLKKERLDGFISENKLHDLRDVARYLHDDVASCIDEVQHDFASLDVDGQKTRAVVEDFTQRVEHLQLLFGALAARVEALEVENGMSRK